MLIAHGPLGYLMARSGRRWWNQPAFTAQQTRRLYWIAFIGGLLPDIDLVYFYLIDATVSHRQLLSHSALAYSLLFVVSLLVRCSTRWRWFGTASCLFAVAGLSHIAADMFIGMTAAFGPVSDQLIGLVSFRWYRQSWFMQYSLVTNFLAEWIIIVLAGYTVVAQRQRYLNLVAGLTILVSASVWLVDHSAYKPNGYYYYSDDDHDGVVNAQDRDSDGDGLVNVIDDDIDDDGEDNSLELYHEIFSITGAWYDYTGGRFIEIPLRLGFVSEQELVQRAFGNVGIFFTTELVYAYQADATGYRGQPTSNEFADDPYNWQVWLARNGKLLAPTVQPNEFDIVFFQSGHVALFWRDHGRAVVVEADRSYPRARIVPLQQVVQREGKIIAFGRLLPKPYSKRY